MQRFALWGIVMVVLAFASPAKAAREISPKRECSICHVMWLDDFKQRETTTLIPYDPKPLVETGRQDVVSTERMCFSCHDGYVRDSRFAWAKREHFHPVGIEPPADINIPKIDGKDIFPLNDDGKIYCGTCHSAHGVDWSEEYSPLFLRVQNRDSSLCLACHLDRSTGPEEGNHPVYKKLSHIPERLLEEGAKFGADGDVICQSCHRVHGAGGDKLLMIENGNSQLCGTCHADRYTHDKGEAARAGTHPVNISPGRVEIPESLLREGARLGQQGEVICQTCHRPHAAQQDAAILVARNDGSALCQRCHTEKRSIVGTKHDVTASDREAREEVCGSCHRPHRGKGPKMWARIPGESEDPMAGTCLGCHRQGGLAEARQVGTHTHPIGRGLNSVDNRQGLPGYDELGLKSGDGRISCPTCHDPHVWDPRNPDNRGTSSEPGTGDNRFLRVRHTADGNLCRACHADKDALAGSPHDPAQMLMQDPELKALLPQGIAACNTCHTVHNGKGPRMWALDPALGTDPVSSTCLSCHRDGGIASDRTVGTHTHPVGVPIASVGIVASMEGWVATVKNLFERAALIPLPLFDRAGRRTEGGGNVTCATCHDPHTHATTEIPARARFLRIPNDEEAALCRNCHADKGQVQRSKHNLRITAPEEKNIQGTAAGETHACAACHLPHNGGGPKMWAGFTRPSDDPMAELCLGCHQEGGVAEEKQIGTHSHPVRVDVKSVGLDTRLPLFRRSGARDAEDGRVACATCHDPHQWDPAQPDSEAGASAEAEGDGRDSFLRLTSAGPAELCIDCHEDKQWVRGTDHDLAVTAAEARNTQGQDVAGSGVCSQCHTPHNATVAQRLWSRAPGPGQDPMETLCRSCHAAEKLAAAKQPRRATHPSHVKAVSVPGWPRPGEVKGGIFPVFDSDGNSVRAGAISCPTCHNPHQWSPTAAREGAGRNLEGNARSSFLRNKSDYSLCTNCHGMDALFRYKYFHGESSRVPHNLYR